MRDGVPYGNFLLLKRLAVGGMAELFLATPKSGSSMPARIALKRILPVFSGDPDFLRAFLDEARVAALLSHPRFARTYEVGEVDGSLYLAMDYVDGVSLSTLSKAAQKAGVNFPWPLMVRIAIDLCEALHLVHNLKSLDGAALQLVHRDVSLSNVMVDRSGEVKLIDFGIARSSFQWHRTLPGVVKANLACAAPELFRGAAVDARADLYGVGLSVYEMLLGRHAFTAAEPDILRAVLEDAPAPLAEQRRDLPPRLCQLVHSALAKDPARRPRTAQEMGAALEACLAEAGLKVAQADVARFLAQHVAADSALAPEGGGHTDNLRPPKTGTTPRALVNRVLVAGDRVGRYLIVGPLAQGGMADVWLARSVDVPGKDQMVVLKTINQDLASRSEFVHMFLDEARVAAHINHPNVVQILDLGEDRGCYFIAMEHLDGRTAHRIWRDLSPLPFPLTAHIIAECCAGLSFVHDLRDASGTKLNIVHRDISPDNILVTYAGQVKLIDFGIAKAAVNSHLTDPGVVRGKVSYFAPEQSTGGVLDWRVDIWGLGVNLYQLATGQVPFRENSIEALMLAINAKDPELPSVLRPNFPPALERIIMRALEKDPAQRYSSAAAMRAELTKYLATEEPITEKSLASLMESVFPLEERAFWTELPTSKMPIPRHVSLTVDAVSAIPAIPTAQLKVPRRKWAALGSGLLLAALGGAWVLVQTPQAGPPVPVERPFNPVFGDPAPVAVVLRDPDPVPVDLTPVEEALPPAQPPVAVVNAPAPKPVGILSLACNIRCDVELDGKKVGSTPLVLKRVPVGRHEVRVVALGEDSQTKRELVVQVAAGQTTTKKLTFGTGQLSLRVSPWADVKVDGKLVGQTPMPPLAILEGPHEILLENGPLSLRKKVPVTITAGKHLSLTIEMKE